MNLTELKEEFKIFIEDISLIHSNLKEIIESNEKIFYDNCQIGKKIKSLEGNLYYLDKFNFDLQDIMDNYHNIVFEDKHYRISTIESESTKEYGKIIIFPPQRD